MSCLWCAPAFRSCAYGMKTGRSSCSARMRRSTVRVMDEHTFLYTASAFYQTALTLAELEGRYGELGYLRVSKSAVINLHRIRSLKSRTGGRIEASLENGERLVVSRHYAPLLRERLGHIKGGPSWENLSVSTAGACP